MYKGIIYKYTSPSGKCYIGQTTKEDERRRKFINVKGKYSSPQIDNARRKYGPEVFLYEVIFACELDDKESLLNILNEKEIFYIDFYNSIEMGYNNQIGGLNFTKTQKSIDITTKKISKIVLQYDLEGNFIHEWASTMEVERMLGIEHTQISSNCLGRLKYCHEWNFKYKQDDNFPLKISKVIAAKSRKRFGLCKVDLNGIEIGKWNSVKEAAECLHMCRNNLKKIAMEEKEYKGYIYKLIEYNANISI